VPPPNGKSWQRAEAVAWIAARKGRWVIGLDCAFALPRVVAQAWGCATGPDLWRRVDVASADDDDFHAAGAVADPHLTQFFWQRGARPAGWVAHHRVTELACRADGLGAPETPLKLIGAKQVGWGGLAGMRVLHHLRTHLGQRLAVWPFEPVNAAEITMVEIFPRLFLRWSGHGGTKVRGQQALDAVLSAFGAPASGLPLGAAISDHDADALVAAAGMRALSLNPVCWAPAALDHTTATREGWILGVGGGLAGNRPSA
jgi:hypothetical protein